MASSIRN